MYLFHDILLENFFQTANILISKFLLFVVKIPCSIVSISIISKLVDQIHPNMQIPEESSFAHQLFLVQSNLPIRHQNLLSTPQCSEISVRIAAISIAHDLSLLFTQISNLRFFFSYSIMIIDRELATDWLV